jgi:hypothetical protein
LGPEEEGLCVWTKKSRRAEEGTITIQLGT